LTGSGLIGSGFMGSYLVIGSGYFFTYSGSLTGFGVAIGYGLTILSSSFSFNS